MKKKQIYMSQMSILVMVVLFLLPTLLHAQTMEYEWQAAYYNNKDLSGSPALTRTDNHINFDWGINSPDPGVIHNDQFSVRWTRTLDVAQPGHYQFTTTTDDGVRLWVNGRLLIDEWQVQSATPYAAEIDLPTGQIPIVMEYFEDDGTASAHLDWELIANDAVAGDAWRGEYYTNQNLAGKPRDIIFTDDINFDWGIEAPATYIPPDHFSVRWTRNVDLPPGRYHFTVHSDDGVRLWVDGRLLINQWHEHVATPYTAEITLEGGPTPIVMEYYEDKGEAQAQLSWEPIADITITDPADWRGEYFNNMQLLGEPVWISDDPDINFNWGATSPLPGLVPEDHFSTRWTRAFTLNPGRYRFAVSADDGVRLWINDTLLINEWREEAVTPYSAEIDLPDGEVNARLEYFENVGLAQVHLAWTPVTPPVSLTLPPPATLNLPDGSTATATVVNAYRLNARLGPGVTNGVIEVLNLGQTVGLTGYANDDGSWLEVILPDGRTGWVNAHYLAVNAPASG